MSRKQFEASKREICRLLRKKDDPSPRALMPGSPKGGDYYHNLRVRLREEGEGAKVLRGYKLFHLPLSKKRFSSHAFKALFHMVVSVTRELASGTHERYIDANGSLNPEHQFTEYIFLPSSLAHANLTDEQLLSGLYITGAVIGGNQKFCAMLVADQRMRGRHKGVIGRTPADCVARDRVKFFRFPFFSQWFDQLNPRAPVDEAACAEMMGFPVCKANESLEDNSISEMADLVVHNREMNNAVLDGRVSLQFYIEFIADRNAGLYTEQKAMELWYNHYDERCALLNDYLDAKIWSRLLDEL